MLSFLLIAIACVFNASMDVLYAKGDGLRINHKFFNPYKSWVNKWKNGDNKQGERFFLSSTVLVFLTDGWHLFKQIVVLLLLGAIIFYKPLYGYYDALIISVIYFVSFEISYRVLKKIL